LTAHPQLTFAFDHRPALSGEDFLVAPNNSEAVAWLDRWPDWPSPVLAVHGPPACGKTHLAQVFMARSGAVLVAPEAIAESDPGLLLGDARACVIDDAEALVTEGREEALLHFYNTVSEASRHLLLTSLRAPARWGAGLADLRSRLVAATTVAIGPPDDALIAAVLVKLFADRQLRVDEDVVSYMMARMERSLEEARRLVGLVDGTALAEGRKITVPLVRQVLERPPGDGDGG
jgi:chromosomal replication initiation ATPase DnaA